MAYPHSRSTYVDLAGGDTHVHAFISDEAFLTALVEFERALAIVAANAGALTEEERDAAVAAIDSFAIDVEAISKASAAGANPAIPVAKALKQDGGRGIHIGATSQDAIDTALALCVRRAGQQVLADAARLAEILRDLAVAHRATPMIGRTLGQQANPTTFGLIAAGWLEGLEMAMEDVEGGIGRLPVQYSGATGTLAATHPHGIEIHDGLAAELGLAARPLVWHTNRVPFTRVATALAQLAGACRKIAADVVFLSATEVGELREATPGGSSSMPHKANPAAAVAADGYARRASGLAATMLDALDSRLQRGVGSWHAEWPTLRELVAVTASAVARTTASLDGIRVDSDAMVAHLNDTATQGHALELVDDILNSRKD